MHFVLLPASGHKYEIRMEADLIRTIYENDDIYDSTRNALTFSTEYFEAGVSEGENFEADLIVSNAENIAAGICLDRLCSYRPGDAALQRLHSPDPFRSLYDRTSRRRARDRKHSSGDEHG